MGFNNLTELKSMKAGLLTREIGGTTYNTGKHIMEINTSPPHYPFVTFDVYRIIAGCVRLVDRLGFDALSRHD